MKPERTELSSGIYFTRIPMDAFKMFRLTVYLTVPLTDESAASRIALLPYVLRCGTTTYPTASSISRRLEELYSADLGTGVTKVGDNQVLIFSVGGLRRDFVPDHSDLLAPIATLLTEILFAPHIEKNTGVFPDEHVEREKKNACDRIRALQNNKAAYAAKQCLSLMCENEPAGISEAGTVEEIEQITPASLYAAYRSLLAEARIEIFYTGTEGAEEVTSLLLPALHTLHRHPLSLPATKIIYKAEKRKRAIERVMAHQGKLCIGFRCGVSLADEDATAFTLFHTIYGGSPSSKLFANVRERLSLCYSCSSRLQLTKGLFLVSAGIENKNKRSATHEILRQLKKMRAGKITENELHMAYQTLLAQTRSIADEPAAIERWYFIRAILNIEESPEDFMEALSRVTMRDITRVAKKVTLDTVYFLRAVSEGREEEEYDE